MATRLVFRSRLVPIAACTVALVALLASLAACTGGSDETGSAGKSRSIEHVWGTTEVRGTPKRVIALGVTDVDPVLALGTTPVAAAGYRFFGDQGAIGPWAQSKVQGKAPRLLASDSEVDIEEIASLSPDLIVAISSGIDETAYGQLSKIAPTIARPDGTAPYTATRDQATRMIATALDRERQGEDLIERANAAFDQASQKYPELNGATGTVVLPYDGRYGAYTPGDARGQVLDQLGLQLPPALAAEDNGDSFFVEVSAERADLLESDVLVALVDPGQKDTLLGDRLFSSLDVVQRGSLIVDDGDIRGALTYNTVLSAPFAVEQLAPRLAKAVRIRQDPAAA